MRARKTIDRLSIKGFKSIQSLENFQVRGLNVLIGANGAGKSNFLSYFQMLRAMASGNLQHWIQKQGDADRILSFGLKTTGRLTSRIEFGQDWYEFVLEPMTGEGLFFSDERACAGGSAARVLEFGSGHKEARLRQHVTASKPSNVGGNFYDAISRWRTFHFHDTSDTARVKRKSSLHQGAALESDASNLAAFLFGIREQAPDSYEQIRRTVRLAMPFFDDFELSPEMLATGEEQALLLWRQIDSSYVFHPGQLSDGSIRFICLATALLQPDPPSTILVDEPELGLHPYAITLLGSLLRSASERMQVIVSTQSVPLINEFTVDDLIVVEREEEASVFKRFTAQEFADWLEDYTLGELWEKNVLGGRPRR
ncbi:MAG: AAA family ATPase [Candidatus Hydrogenedentes bacterium]|nr:AAA family ATPase [Candidatus Hydrogenedentota bacterium]